MNDAKVTWLLAVKNGMPYLPETLASIEAQTYKSWKVLVWDNGSTDGTLEILKQWIPERLPGRVVADQPMNLGLSRAEMVKESRTEFCALIDADDVNLPERLEKQVAFLEAQPEVAVVGSQMNRLDKDGANHGLFCLYPVQPDDALNASLHENPIGQPSVLFRRSMILDVGNYRNVGPVNIEDYDLWLRVAARYKIANLDVPLVNYRVHDKSTTQLAFQQNTLKDAMKIRFCEHAPTLFGCTEEEAWLLFERSHPRTIQVLKKIALYLDKGDRKKAETRMKTDSFLAAGHALTDPRDIPSRLALASLGGGNRSLVKEAASVAKAAVKKTLIKSIEKFPKTGSIYQLYHTLKIRRKEKSASYDSRT